MLRWRHSAQLDLPADRRELAFRTRAGASLARPSSATTCAGTSKFSNSHGFKPQAFASFSSVEKRISTFRPASIA